MKHDRIYQYGMLRVMMLVVVCGGNVGHCRQCVWA